MAMVSGVMFRAKWLICQEAIAHRVSPVSRISRMSIRPTIRPTRNIDSRVPTPRGAMTRPVVQTGYSSSTWASWGSRAMVA